MVPKRIGKSDIDLVVSRALDKCSVNRVVKYQHVTHKLSVSIRQRYLTMGHLVYCHALSLHTGMPATFSNKDLVCDYTLGIGTKLLTSGVVPQDWETVLDLEKVTCISDAARFIELNIETTFARLVRELRSPGEIVQFANLYPFVLGKHPSMSQKIVQNWNLTDWSTLDDPS